MSNFFEKAIYATTQRHDESNDSFISRMEGFFTELIARKTILEEIQAYVLLRQSTLTSEDKKKILLEHGGKLTYPPAVKSLRLIGSKFFHEFQTGKASTKTKVYDSLISEEVSHHPDEASEKPDRSCWTSEKSVVSGRPQVETKEARRASGKKEREGDKACWPGLPAAHADCAIRRGTGKQSAHCGTLCRLERIQPLRLPLQLPQPTWRFRQSPFLMSLRSSWTVA